MCVCGVFDLHPFLFILLYKFDVNEKKVKALTNGISTLDDIDIQEYVDVYGDYFDLERDSSDETDVRQMMYESNLIDIDPDFYFDPEAYKVLLGNSFIKGIGDFKITPPAFTEAELLSLCNPEDSIVDELNSEFTVGGLTLAQVYELKRQLIAKYVSSDFYFLNTTQVPASSGLLFSADSPTNNLLNLQTADIAAVQSNEHKLLRDVGLFFKPDAFGIFKLNSGRASFTIDEENLEEGKIYIFPDPNIYGNVGVNSQEAYPYIHTFDFRDNIRNVSSGVATGDPKITNKSLTFEPYSVKQRQLQELAEMNSLGYRLNFSDLYNKGSIRKLGYDSFGNEYALFKAKKLAEAAGGSVLAAHKTLCWFVLVGWAIYPLGYMAGTPGWYDGLNGMFNMDIIYNIGDAVNKIGFGLVVYNLAVQSTEK